jgi:hypothetical protein
MKQKEPRKTQKFTGSKGQTGPKLSGKNQRFRVEIWKMLALGFSPVLVSQEIKDNFGIEISRQAIRETYQKNPKYAKVISALRERMAVEVMQHPLANKRVRLTYLLRALNHALKWGTDKLYFDKEGNLVGKIEKVQLGVIAQLIREARDEIEGTRKDEGELGRKKVDLLQVIKVLSSEQGNATIIENRIGPGQAETVGVDPSGARGYEIL